MRPILPLILALALVAGCAKNEPEAKPVGDAAAESQPGAHPALNKLDDAKKDLAEVERKRAEEQKAAQGEAAGQDP